MSARRNSSVPAGGIVPATYATIAALAIGNLFIWHVARRTQDPRTLRVIGAFAYGLDIGVVLANVWLGSYDENATGWNLAYILPLEGAIRYELRGVASSIGFFFASELAREAYRLQLFPDLRFEIAAVTFRVGVFAIIAFVAGIMARNLKRQTFEAEMQAESNARLVDLESQARTEIQAIHDVVQAGLAGGPFDETMRSIVDAIASGLGYERIAIRLIEDAHEGPIFRCVATHGFAPSTEERTIPLGVGVAGRAIASGRSQLVDDLRTDPDYIPWVVGNRSEMVVPIRSHDEPIGVLEVQSSQAQTFVQAELERVERFASQIGLVVSNAHLLERERTTIERLRQLDKMKSDFVAVTSHELRTPLTSVQGFIKTLRRTDVTLAPDQVQQFLAIIDRQSERLARLVEDLLLTARIESGTIELNFSSVDVALALSETLDELQGGRNRVQLVVDPSLGPVVTDGCRLHQIARNLIENALKFSTTEMPVRVSAFADGPGTLLLEFADRGPGIPQAEISHIFERFHQVGDALRRDVDGLGLGLYIVKNLVDALNGSIEVRSALGEGTTFSVRLPLVSSAGAHARGA